MNKEDTIKQISKMIASGEIPKEIMELPKIEINNPISAMNSISVDDLMSAIDRFDKVPTYDELLKENQQLKEELKALRKGLNKVVSKRKKWKYRYDKEKMKNRRAKSYIKNNYHLNWYIESNYKDELLQILDKGERDE